MDLAIVPIDSRIKTFSHDKGVIQEYLFSLEKRLYASKEYVKEHGRPKTVQDLKHHRLLAISHPEKHPLTDVNWILRLGMPAGKINEPVFTSNSLECIVDAAVKGHGILSSYPEMELVKNSSLINVLPKVKGTRTEQYLYYPSYLEKDNDIINVKKYLHERLSR